MTRWNLGPISRHDIWGAKFIFYSRKIYRLSAATLAGNHDKACGTHTFETYKILTLSHVSANLGFQSCEEWDCAVSALQISFLHILAGLYSARDTRRDAPSLSFSTNQTSSERIMSRLRRLHSWVDIISWYLFPMKVRGDSTLLVFATTRGAYCGQAHQSYSPLHSAQVDKHRDEIKKPD